jgi:hypothetical protein
MLKLSFYYYCRLKNGVFCFLCVCFFWNGVFCLYIVSYGFPNFPSNTQVSRKQTQAGKQETEHRRRWRRS